MAFLAAFFLAAAAAAAITALLLAAFWRMARATARTAWLHTRELIAAWAHRWHHPRSILAHWGHHWAPWSTWLWAWWAAP